MSEAHFHVHGPHDHAVEHHAQAGDAFAGRIAVLTAILATVGALFGYQAGATQNAALLHKNEAAIRRTQASDQWNFYQAKSSKQNLAELGATLAASPSEQERYRKEIERYGKEKDQIMADAKKLEQASDDAEKASEASMHAHHRWAQAMTLVQIAIALGAISLLTRRRALVGATLVAAGVGVAVGALALAHV